jgi:hypothetical protein
MKLLSDIYTESTNATRISDITFDETKCDHLLSILLNKKVTSLSNGTTGRISKIHYASLGEDRYTSVDIDWDNGNTSHRLFASFGNCVMVYDV